MLRAWRRSLLPLRKFANDINLHLIFAENRAAYDETTAKLHGLLTQMIVSTNYYLKIPATTYNGRHFSSGAGADVIAGRDECARVYGSDYVVVQGRRRTGRFLDGSGVACVPALSDRAAAVCA